MRVLRTSNGYRFNDPKGAGVRGGSSKSDFQSGTAIQDLPSTLAPPALPEIDLTTELGAAILRCQAARERRMLPA